MIKLALIVALLSLLFLVGCNKSEPEPPLVIYCYHTYFDPRGDYNDIRVESHEEPAIIQADSGGVILRFSREVRVEGDYNTPYPDEVTLAGGLVLSQQDGFFTVEFSCPDE